MKDTWIYEYMQTDENDDLYYHRARAVTKGAQTIILEELEKKLVSKSRPRSTELVAATKKEYSEPKGETEILASKFARAANVSNWTLPYWRDMAEFVLENKFIQHEPMARALCAREGNDPDENELWVKWIKYADAMFCIGERVLKEGPV